MPKKSDAGKTAAKKTQIKKAKPGSPKAKKASKSGSGSSKTAQILKSEVVYQGNLFRVTQDTIVEPNGHQRSRDVVRHHGSVVILALDSSKSKKDPWVVMERQYRHAANQYLWELPAGKLDPGEDPLAGAKRELEEETGYQARRWTPLVEYFASPGFLGETMKVFIAEGLIAGEARPEEDEHIDMRLIKFSDVIKLIEKGGIYDGKTLSSILLYDHLTRGKRKK